MSLFILNNLTYIYPNLRSRHAVMLENVGKCNDNKTSLLREMYLKSRLSSNTKVSIHLYSVNGSKNQFNGLLLTQGGKLKIKSIDMSGKVTSVKDGVATSYKFNKYKIYNKQNSFLSSSKVNIKGIPTRKISSSSIVCGAWTCALNGIGVSTKVIMSFSFVYICHLVALSSSVDPNLLVEQISTNPSVVEGLTSPTNIDWSKAPFPKSNVFRPKIFKNWVYSSRFYTYSESAPISEPKLLPAVEPIDSGSFLSHFPDDF